MLIKSKNKKVRMCLIVGTICIVVAGLWTFLVTPEVTLAKKPGDSGTAPVCVEFRDDITDGVQSDDGTPYCDDKQLKVEAIMTQDGHVNLQLNADRCNRTFYVDMVLPDGSTVSTKGWRFLVGGWNESFDMRDMDIGEVNKRTDVNLIINTKAPNAPDGNHWRLIFDPTYDRWGIDYTKSTYVTVERTDADTWKIQNTTGEFDENGNPILSQAVRVIQTRVKNKSEFTYGGVVTVPQFTATVTLN